MPSAPGWSMRNCLSRLRRLSDTSPSGFRNTYLPGQITSISSGEINAAITNPPAAALYSPCITKRRAIPANSRNGTITNNLTQRLIFPCRKKIHYRHICCWCYRTSTTIGIYIKCRGNNVELSASGRIPLLNRRTVCNGVQAFRRFAIGMLFISNQKTGSPFISKPFLV